jgi:hypothetical protein
MKRDFVSLFAMVLAACGGAVAGSGSSTFADADAGDDTPSSSGSGPCPSRDQTLTFDLSSDEMRAACEPDAAAPMRPSDDGGADATAYDPVDAGCACATACEAKLHTTRVDSCYFVGTSRVDCLQPVGCLGRRPAGLAPHTSDADDPHVAFLLACAHLEAASVVAFERVAREVERLGAPATFAARMRDAARDEVRHAETMTALAGALAPPVALAEDEAARGALEIALENAREGCVRETFGALVAHRQARAASRADVRNALATIPDDETRHAELSWDLAAWLDARLDDAGRAAVARASKDAIAELQAELAVSHGNEELGLPDAREAVALANALFASDYFST